MKCHGVLCLQRSFGGASGEAGGGDQPNWPMSALPGPVQWMAGAVGGLLSGFNPWAPRPAASNNEEAGTDEQAQAGEGASLVRTLASLLMRQYWHESLTPIGPSGGLITLLCTLQQRPRSKAQGRRRCCRLSSRRSWRSVRPRLPRCLRCLCAAT